VHGAFFVFKTECDFVELIISSACRKDFVISDSYTESIQKDLRHENNLIGIPALPGWLRNRDTSASIFPGPLA
jgi:hypothetical protein